MPRLVQGGQGAPKSLQALHLGMALGDTSSEDLRMQYNSTMQDSGVHLSRQPIFVCTTVCRVCIGQRRPTGYTLNSESVSTQTFLHARTVHKTHRYKGNVDGTQRLKSNEHFEAMLANPDFDILRGVNMDNMGEEYITGLHVRDPPVSQNHTANRVV